MWIVLVLSLSTLSWHKVVAFSLLTVSVVWLCLMILLIGRCYFLLLQSFFFIILKFNWKYNARAKSIYEVGIVLSAIALFFHLWPGFHNPVVLNSVTVGPQSTPYTMYFNFDKALVPFLLVLCTSSLFKKEVKSEVSLWKWGGSVALCSSYPVFGCFFWWIKARDSFS